MNANTNAGSPIEAQLGEKTISAYATTGILSCTPDAPLAEVAGLMARNRVHAIVVADDRAPEPPVISDLDLVSALASSHFDELSARDIAGTEAITVFEDETLGRAAQLLSDHRVSHVIVRNDRRAPVGIVSTWDIAAAVAESD